MTAPSPGNNRLLVRKRVCDLETAVSVFLKLTKDEAYRCMLESVTGGHISARYSIIAMRPDQLWRVVDGKAHHYRLDETGTETLIACDADVLASLRARLATSRVNIPSDLPPMAAGWLGVMGFGMARLFDRGAVMPNHALTPSDDALLIRPRLTAVLDHITGEITLCAPIYEDSDPQAQAKLLAESAARLDATISHAPLQSDIKCNGETTPRLGKERYQQLVAQGKEHILAGDIFQIVLSEHFSRPFPLPAFDLYRALRRTNPSPYMYFLEFRDTAVVGASPETLVKLADGRVTVRPIAGTRRRGQNAAEDRALAADLLADPKERAEHLMLLDLGRNDVGRVAAPGSVTVTDSYTVEHYSHVMHIVSNVEGALAEDKDAIDALAAGFPAGTVSGAPKIKAMRLIDSLEGTSRGYYAGSVGYFSAGGDMDSCILLRTAFVSNGVMTVQAGAGIVADSDPASEYQECVNKAEALFHAAAVAIQLAASDADAPAR